MQQNILKEKAHVPKKVHSEPIKKVTASFRHTTFLLKALQEPQGSSGA